MKKFNTSFIICLFIFFNQSFSQTFGECGTSTNIIYNTPAISASCLNTGAAWITKYRTPQYWIPNASTPIKTILVNYIVCQDNNGNNAWQDSQPFRDQVDQMFIEINNRYSNAPRH